MEANKYPIRVLVTAPLCVGGVTSLMINIQEKLDRQCINFDYLVFHDRKEPREDYVKEMGSRKIIASVDDGKNRYLRRIIRFNKIRKVCKENHVQILHYNVDSPADLTSIIAARLGGVKYITIHSHNTAYANQSKSERILGNLIKGLIPCFCDTYWACSDLAARFLLS